MIRTKEQRFWNKVTVAGEEECWVWHGGTDKGGYGRLFSGPRNAVVQEKAHRVSWELAHQQKVPTGLDVLHTCDNPPCVNPKHLYAGTKLDNVRDRVQRGRSAKGADYPDFKRYPETEQRVSILYRQGMSTRQVAATLGLSKSMIAKIVEGARSRSASTSGSRNGAAKITESIVIQIRSSPEPAMVLADRYGVSRGTIEDIRSKRSWAHILVEAVPVTKKLLVTQCRYGHPYNETNNWRNSKTGKRACRVCNRDRARIRRIASP